MLIHAICSLPLLISQPTSTSEGGLLAAVPPKAFALVHGRDLAGLNERAARNDWVTMMSSSEGEPLYVALADGFLDTTHTDLADLLPVASAVRGESVLFVAETSVGFVTEPPVDREALADAMREWLPRRDGAPGKVVMLSGARVELAEWPDEIHGWSGRKGHFAAFVDHPSLLGLFSGDTADAVLEALSASIRGHETGVEPPLATAYREAGGGASGGIELYIDFSRFAEVAEEALRAAARDMVPDPALLLGLERGTWLHATADMYPGTRIDCRATLHLPTGTLAAKLADSFGPLPHTLPAELPSGVESLWALRWDIAGFYATARAALLAGGGEDGVQLVDQGLAAAEGMTGVDPVEDVVEQLEGTFAFYLLDGIDESGSFDELAALGFLAHLVDGDAFFDAFDTLVSGIGDALELVEVEGVDAYVFDDGPRLDGGFAFLPKAFVIAPARETLQRALRAISGAEDASLVDGSRMQAAIDENAGACFLTVVELTSFRGMFLGVAGANRASDAESSSPADPFDSQLVGSARRTADGFELGLQTR